MSDEQRWPEAFARVSEAKAAVDRLVAQVEHEGVQLSAVFERAEVDPLVGRIFALKVFEAIPGIGKVRARRAMGEVGIDEHASLAELTTGQRTAIAEALAER